MFKFILNSCLNLDLMMSRHNVYEACEFSLVTKKYFSNSKMIVHHCP